MAARYYRVASTGTGTFADPVRPAIPAGTPYAGVYDPAVGTTPWGIKTSAALTTSSSIVSVSLATIQAYAAQYGVTATALASWLAGI